MGTLLEKTRHKSQSEALMYGASCLEDGEWVRVYSEPTKSDPDVYLWIVEVRDA